jgi:hypothetical protein
MKKILLTLIVSVAFCGSIFAQPKSNPNGYESHWADAQFNWFEDVDYPSFFLKLDNNIVTYDDRWYDYEIASFVGDECRGHDFMTADYLVFGWGYPMLEGLMVKFDTSGEEVTFKMFDHFNGIEYDLGITNLPVNTGETHIENWFLWSEDFDQEGWEEYALILSFTTSEPTTVTQTIELTEGWNWFSLYIEVEDPIEALQMLEEALGDNATMISASEIYTEYLGDGLWIGDLDDEGVYNEQMYMIETVTDCEIELEGTLANAENYTIDINPGWNWIGFPHSEELLLEDALINFAAEEEDQFAEADVYSEYGFGMWIGDIETLVPGHGYMYFFNGDDTRSLVYNAEAKRFVFTRRPVDREKKALDDSQTGELK